MTQLQTREITPAESNQWDQLVDDAAAGCLYLKSTWAALITEHYGNGRGTRIGTFSGNRLVGGVTGLARDRLKRPTLVMPLLTLYGGPLIAPDASDPDAVAAELTHYLHRFGLVNLIAHPTYTHCDPFANAGYRVGLRHTYHLNLQADESTIWNRFENNVHRNIRKAEKAGYEITYELENVSEAVQLFEAPFSRRGGRSNVPRGFLAAILSGKELASNRHIITAHREGQLVSYIAWLMSGSTAYYAVAATRPDCLASGVSSLLIRNSIRDLQAAQIAVIDFAGANIPSIAAFKARFGCELISYPVFRRVGSRRLKAALAVRSLLSRSKDGE